MVVVVTAEPVAVSVRSRRAVPHLLQRAGPLALAGLAANGLGVALTIALARLLDSRGYGAYASLVGLSLILSMPGSALVVAVVRTVSDLRATGRGVDVEAWSTQLRRRLLLVAVTLPVLGVGLGGAISDALSLPTPAGIALVVSAAGVWALLGFERGLLQAGASYGALGRNLLVEAGVRTVATFGLVGAGAGVAGAAGGVLAANLAAVAHARRHQVLAAARGVQAGVLDAAGADRPSTGRARLRVDAATALGVLALLAVLQTLDVLVVGRAAPESSGSYAAISVTSKALVFVGFALSQYLLPEAARCFSEGRHALHQLGVSLGLLAVPAAGLLLTALLAPELLLRTVFGPDLLDAAHALSTLVLATTALGAAVLLAYYLLGAGRREVVAVLAAAAVAVALALDAAHGEPLGTARALLACNAALAGVLAVMAVRTSQVDRRRASRSAIPGGV